MSWVKILRVVLPWAVFAAALWLMVARFDWSALWGVLERMDLVFALWAGLLAIVLCWVCRGLRTWWLLRALDTPVPPLACVLSQCVGGGLATVTPGQIGEAVRVEMLKSAGHLDRGGGYAVFLGERFMDLVVLVLGGLVVMLWGVETSSHQGLVIWIAAGVCGLVLIMLAWAALGPIPERFSALQQPLRRVLIRGDLVAVNLVGSLLSWGWTAVLWGVLLASVHIDITALEIVQVLVIVMLAVIASLIPGGLAVSEVVAAALLIEFGVEQAHAEAGAIALRLAGLEAGLIGLLAWMWWRQIGRRAGT